MFVPKRSKIINFVEIPPSALYENMVLDISLDTRTEEQPRKHNFTGNETIIFYIVENTPANFQKYVKLSWHYGASKCSSCQVKLSITRLRHVHCGLAINSHLILL